MMTLVEAVREAGRSGLKKSGMGTTKKSLSESLAAPSDDDDESLQVLSVSTSASPKQSTHLGVHVHRHKLSTLLDTSQ